MNTETPMLKSNSIDESADNKLSHENTGNEAMSLIAIDVWKPEAETVFAKAPEQKTALEQNSVTESKPETKAISKSIEPLEHVNPFIGTDGHGHTYPGATVPFGRVQLSPDTRRETWDGCSGYHYSDKQILGFSHTHLSGTGCGDLGDISFMPTSAKIAGDSVLDLNDFKAQFSHKDETASPGYYSVQMGDIKAELTASKHVGMHRYTFANESKDGSILIDLTRGIHDRPTELSLKVIDEHTILGLRRSNGWASNQYEYFAAKFSKPIKNHAVSIDQKRSRSDINEARGKALTCSLSFDTSDGEPVIAKVGLSSVSEAAALKNLEAEAPGFDFDKMHEEARKSWGSELSKISLSTNDESKATAFYTALYHSLLAPTIVSDVDGGYRGSDGKVHYAEGFENYSTFSLWDTFRAEHPLLTIVEPERVNDMVQSMYVHALHSPNKQLPVWTLASNETNTMIGYHSFPVIADAYLKGFRNWDAEGMFKIMLENTKRNDWWAQRGYMPADKEKESVSKTLEFAYDDWCLSKFAEALGHTAEAEKYAKRAEAYKNVFDKQSGFMRGRLQNGKWRTPFDPTQVASGDFTEANAWQYSFFVPHDVGGMINMYGGRKNFVNKLDEMFTTKTNLIPDVTGTIGQYAQGNEPSHHVAYLYSYAGAPDKTAEHVREIRDTLYDSSPEGLSGNDDCGQMSAWYIFSSLGFYPVNPASGEYVIGTPAFDGASINLPGGKKFEVAAPGLSDKAIYVESATLNGKPLDRTYITHDEIMQGGKLELKMTAMPGDWGRDEQAAPH